MFFRILSPFLTLLIFCSSNHLLNAQCDQPEGIRIIEVRLEETDSDPSNQGGSFVKLEVMGYGGEGRVDLRNWIIDDNNEALLNVGTTPGHLILGDCFADLPHGTIILIYDNNKIPEGIDPAADGWSADGTTLQVPLESPCFSKMTTCPNTSRSIYCREAAGQANWSDIIGLRSDGDIFQIRNRIGQLVQAVQWGETQFSDGGGPETYVLEQGECRYQDRSIVVEYLSPIGINVSVDRVIGTATYELGITIEGGLPPFEIKTNGGYTFETDERYHAFFTSTQTNPLRVEVIGADGCRDEEEVRFPEYKQETRYTCEGVALDIGLEWSELPRDKNIICVAWEASDSSDLFPSPKISVLPTQEETTYTLYLIDKAGNIVGACEFLVIKDEIPVLILPQVEQALCSEGNFPIEVEAVATDGSDPADYSYAWSSGQTSAQIEILADGIYTVTLTRMADGCQGVAAYEVKPGAEIYVKAEFQKAEPICPGDFQTLSILAWEGGPMDFDANSDYQTRFSIDWPDGSSTQNLSSYDIYYPGTYQVTITDHEQGCSIVKEYEVDFVDFPLSPSEQIAYQCDGGPVTLSVGQPYDTYTWSTGATSESITVNTPGSYTLSVSATVEGKECTQDGIEFEVIDQVLSAAIKVGPGYFCETDKVLLTVEHTAISPIYRWSNGSERSQIEITPDGIYAVTIIDAATNCSISREIEIYSPEEDISALNFLPEHLNYCPGSNQILQLERTPNWIAALTWVDPLGVNSTTNNIPINSAGTYELYIESVGGCTYYLPIEIVEGLAVSIEIDPADGILCKTDNNLSQLDLVAQVSDAVEPVMYQWSEGSAGTDRITIDEVERYSVTVTDDLGCTGEADLVPPVCLDDDACFPLQACAIEGYSFGQMQAGGPTEYINGAIMAYTTIDEDTKNIFENIVTDAAENGISVGYIFTSSSNDIPLTAAQERYDQTANDYDLLYWLHYDHETSEARLCMQLGDGFFGGPPVSLLRVDNSGYTLEQQQELKGDFIALMKDFFDCSSEDSLIDRLSLLEEENTDCSTGAGCLECIAHCYTTWGRKGFWGIRFQHPWQAAKNTRAWILSNGIAKQINDINNREIPQGLWKDDGTTTLYVHPFQAGIIDAILQDNPLVGIYDFTKMLLNRENWEYISKFLTQEGRAELIAQLVLAAPEMWEALVGEAADFKDRLCGNQGCDEMLHAHGRLIGGIAMFVAELLIGDKGVSTIANLAKNGLGDLASFMSKWVDKLSNIPTNLRERFFKQLQKSFNCAISGANGNAVNLRSLLDACDDLKAFFEDIFDEYGKETRELIIKEEYFVEIWKKYEENADLPLSELEDLLGRFPKNDIGFYDEFERLFFTQDGNGNFTIKEEGTLTTFLNDLESRDADVGYFLLNILLGDKGYGLKAWELILNAPFEVRTNTSILESVSNAIQRGVIETSVVLDNVSIPEINLNTVEHIFRGSTNNGVHHISALMSRPDIQIENRVPTDQGCYKAMVKFPNGQIKPKDFFPDEWDEIKTIQEIEYAFGNRDPRPEWGSGQFLGESSEGIPIRIQVVNGKVTSAYPYFD